MAVKVFISSLSPSKPIITVLDTKIRMCITQKLIFQALSERV